MDYGWVNCGVEVEMKREWGMVEVKWWYLK